MAGHTSRVFISYSHDSEEHYRNVLKLAGVIALEDGLDVSLDQYLANPRECWVNWMDNEVRESDFVLLICTERYRNHFESRLKNGKEKEAWIESHWSEGELQKKKFFPICFDPGDKVFIPDLLKPYKSYIIEIGKPRLLDDPVFFKLYHYIKHPSKGSEEGNRGGKKIAKSTLIFCENSTETTLYGRIQKELDSLRKRLGGNAGIEFHIGPASSLKEMQKWLELKEPSFVHFYGNPPKPAKDYSETIHEDNNHLFVEEEDLEALFGAPLPFLKGVLIDGASSVEQVKAIANNGFHVIGITCSKEEPARMQFLANFYKNFDLMESAGKAYLKGTQNLDVKASENTDTKFTFSLMDRGELKQFKGLEQLGPLREKLEEKEREKAEYKKLLEAEKQKQKPRRAFFLKNNPNKELADWLNQEKNRLINRLTQQILDDPTKEKVEDFKLEMGILISLVDKCLVVRSDEPISSKRLKCGLRFYLSTYLHSNALEFLASQIAEQPFLPESKIFASKIIDMLRDRLLLISPVTAKETDK